MAQPETLDSLKAKYARYDDHYRPLYQEFKEAQKYYDGDFEIARPEGVDPVIPPTARNKIEIAVSQLITDKPTVSRRRQDSDSQSRKDLDDKIELALQAFMLDCEEYQQTPLTHEAANLQMRRGMTDVAGPFYNMDEKRLSFDAYDPQTVYFEPGGWPREAFVHVKMTVAEMCQQAERHAKLADFDPGDRNETDEITLVQWFKAPPFRQQGQPLVSGKYAAWIKEDSTFVKDVTASGYPFLPVDPIYSGWGVRTLGATPKDIAVGLIHPGTRPLLVNEAEMLTMLTGSAGYSVWGRYFLEQGQGAPEGFTIDYTPGSVTLGVPDGGLKLFPFQPLGQEVSQHFARLHALLEEAFFSSILGGQTQPGVGTATAYSLLTGSGRRKFLVPLRMLQSGFSRMLYKVGLLLEYLDQMMEKEQVFTFRGNKLSASMYGGDYSVEINLLAEDEQLKAKKVAEGIAIKQSGLLDDRTILEEYMQTPNASAVEKAKLFQKLVNSDQFLQSVMDEYLKRSGGVEQPTAPALAQPGAIQPQPSNGGAFPMQPTPGPTAFPMGPSPAGGGSVPGQAGNAMDRLSAAYRASKSGFSPNEPGSLPAAVSAIRQTRQLQ